MGPKTAFEALGELLGEYGSGPRSVERVEAETVDGRVEATVALVVPFETLCGSDAPGPREATPADDGTVRLSFPLVPAEALPADAVATTKEARVRGDHLRVTVGLTLGTDGQSTEADRPIRDGEPTEADRSGPDGEDTGAGEADGAATPTDKRTGANADTSEVPDGDGLDAVRDESVPPYDDTEYLERLYEESDSFEQMRRRIPMDVSAETVRRYMIEADVHRPSSYDTAPDDADDGTASSNEEGTTDEGPDRGDADAGADAGGALGDSPEAAERAERTIPDEHLVADGFGLPDGVRVRDIADAVVDSATVYDVRRSLGLEQDQTRELLSELDLLDLVLRPVTAADRTVSHDLVADRIRQCVAEDA